ncbi:TRAP transporter large permease [Azospirillum sp. ST 5-10]|uniref:TRAP transporter large permease n=1 Tax=unclassified Azospirillum TaxID=2630922 RepID=UPI003F49C80C
MIWTLGLLPLVLLALGTPIFAVFLAGAAASFLLVLPTPPIALHQVMMGGLDNYALLAIPFFVFAGELMGTSGIADRMVSWVLAITGRMQGSLGVATVGSCTLVGAVSGSSAAAVAAVGRVLYPRLVRSGYGESYAAGLAASSGAIDIVIPPSIAMILYGAAAEQSIPKLFAAGVLPGLLMAAMMAIFVVVGSRFRDIPRTEGFDAGVFVRATRAALPALSMPVFVLAGIYLGWFSPTEAGGVACVYAIVVARYVHRTMSWGDVLAAASRSALLTAQILIIVAAAGVFSWLLTLQGVPQAITGWLTGLGLTAWEFLLAVNVVLLITGCFLDPTSAILVLAPLLVPSVIQLGIDPIHFGIVMSVNLAIGMFTPPFGLNLFVAQSVFDLPLGKIYRGVMPFVAVQVAALVIITYWPELSLFLARAATP